MSWLIEFIKKVRWRGKGNQSVAQASSNYEATEEEEGWRRKTLIGKKKRKRRIRSRMR